MLQKNKAVIRKEDLWKNDPACGMGFGDELC